MVLLMLVAACAHLPQTGTSTTRISPTRSEPAPGRPASAANSQVYTMAGQQFKLVQVDGGTFPFGADDATTMTVSKAFFLGETEVTYEQWHAVHAWAVAHGYVFA